MNKHIQKENGFGFFLTFLILALGIIISTTLLLTVTTDSKATSKNLGKTQAKDLAIKGVEAAAYSLNEEIGKNFENKKDGVSHGEYIKLLNKEFNKRLCTTNEHFQSASETGTFEVCIDSVPELYKYGEIDYKSATYKVKFKSTGISKSGETETTYKTMLIGSEGFPEALRFALSTYSNGNEKTDGNMYLNGSTDIKGDLKVSNNLIVADAGPSGSLNNNWISWENANDTQKNYNFIPTGLPYLNPAPNNTFSRVIVENKIYKNTFSTPDSRYLSNYLKQLNNPITAELSQNIFRTKSPILQVNREATRSNIDIQHQIDLAKINYPQLSNNVNFTVDRKRPTNKEILDFSSNKAYSFSDTKLFVKGDLNLGGGRTKNYLTLEGNSETGEGVTFYVDGNVNIQNVHLTTNMLIYATGDVTVKESTIKGIDLAEINNASSDIKKLKEGTLIIFSKGNIHFSNNSQYINIPSSIKGFFFSEQNVELFGVGSNLHINGGISANRLILNTINATYSGYGLNFRTVYRNDQTKSRLKVYYDPYLVEAYLKLYPPEPVFYGPDVPIEYEIAS